MDFNAFELNEERKQRFETIAKGNMYLEMKARRPALKQVYISQLKMADPETVYQLHNTIDFVAECLDMCPEYERHEREYTNFLDPFEKVDGKNEVDHLKAVKRFKRSAAGDAKPFPCDVRPPAILSKTLDYLFFTVVAKFGLKESHAFVRDRARAIRNDLTLQNYRGVEAVVLHERIARYHILCSNALLGTDGFVLQQEIEQTRKTLQTLVQYYAEMATKNEPMPHEAEFQAYYLLIFARNNDVPARIEKSVSEQVYFDQNLQLALELRILIANQNDPSNPSVDGSMNNYSRFFSLIRRHTTSYLLASCAQLYFQDIRYSGLLAIQRAYYHTQGVAGSGIPVSDIQKSLGFDDLKETKKFLQHYFIQIRGKDQEIARVGRELILKDGKRIPVAPKFPYSFTPDRYPASQAALIQSKCKGLSCIELLEGKYIDRTDPSSTHNYVDTSNTYEPPSIVQIPIEKTIQPVLVLKRSPKVIIPRALDLRSKDSALPIKTIIDQQNTPSVIMKQDTSKDFFFKSEFQPRYTVPLFLHQYLEPKAVICKLKDNIPAMISNNNTLPQDFPTSPTQNSFTSPIIRDRNTQFQNIIPTKPLITLSPIKKDAIISFTSASLWRIQQFIYNKLINLEIREAIKLQKQARQEYLNLEPVVEAIYHQFLDSLVRDVVAERCDIEQQMQLWRSAIEDVSIKLVNECVQEIAREIFNDGVALRRIIRDYERFGWDRWRYLVIYRNYNVKKNADKGQRMFNLLKGSSLVTSITNNYILPCIDSKRVGGININTLVKEMYDYRASWFKSLGFQNTVIPFVHQGKYKVALAFQGNNPTQSLGHFVEQWTVSKLSGNPTTNNLTNLSSVGLHDGKVQLLIKACKIEHTNKPKSNSTSTLSGLNACIFTSRHYDAPANKIDYWNSIFKNLLAFKTQMPINTQVPFLIINWPSADLQAAEFEEHFNTLINKVFLDNLPMLRILHLDATHDKFDSQKSSSSLTKEVIWLLNHSTKEPIFSSDLFTEITNSIETFEWCFQKLSELVPDSMIQIPKVHSLISDPYIDIYNLFIGFVIDILTDCRLASLSFPAHEFAAFPIDWNSLESFDFMRYVARKSMIPKVTALQSINPSIKEVIQFYTLLIDTIYKLPGANSDILDDLKIDVAKMINGPKLNFAKIFFLITNVTLSFFSTVCNLASRPFIAAWLDPQVFTKAAHNCITNFIATEPFLEFVSPIEPKFKKLREEIQQIVPMNVPKTPLSCAQERLETVMEEAKKLLL